MGYRLTRHAWDQAISKGFDRAAVLLAAGDPTVTYENGRYPGQYRHIRDGIVAVVDRDRETIVTVYANVRETALRPDQTDADARRWAGRLTTA